MLNTFSVLVGVVIGVVVTIPIIKLVLLVKELKRDIKGFYEREKEYTKVVSDMMKAFASFSESMKKNINDLQHSFPTPEEVAKEVLKIKLPIESLPPEMQEEYKKLNEKPGKPVPVDRSYIG